MFVFSNNNSRKDDTVPLVGVDALCSVHCFGSVGWVTRGIWLLTKPCQLSPDIVFWIKIKKKSSN